MPSKKTRKQRRNRRRTLRRKGRKGGAQIINANPDSQRITMPSAGFKIAAPVNSDNAWYKIA